MALVGAQFVNAVSPNPVGSLQAYAGASAPTGWLLCDGTSYSTSVYPELFSVLGYTYGGSGANFNVPDMRGRMPMGAGTGAGLNSSGTGAPSGTAMTARTRGQWGGVESTSVADHVHGSSGMVAATGYVNGNTGWIGVSGRSGAGTGVPGASDYTIAGANGIGSYAFSGYAGIYGNTNAGGAHSVSAVQPFIVTNYIIKAVPDAPRSGLAYGSTPPVVTALPANPQFGEQVLFYSTTPYAGYQLQQWTGASWTILNDSRGVGAWQSWTPTVAQGATNNIAKTVQYAKYVVLGKTVIANCRLDLTANGTAGSQASISIPSEIATASTNPRVGACHIYDASTAVRYTGQAEFLTSTTLGFVGDWSGNNVWGAAPNLALGTSDQIGFSIMYEIA